MPLVVFTGVRFKAVAEHDIPKDTTLGTDYIGKDTTDSWFNFAKNVSKIQDANVMVIAKIICPDDHNPKPCLFFRSIKEIKKQEELLVIIDPKMEQKFVKLCQEDL